MERKTTVCRTEIYRAVQRAKEIANKKKMEAAAGSTKKCVANRAFKQRG